MSGNYNKIVKNRQKTIAAVVLCLLILLLSSCSGDDTYRLAKKIHEYEVDKVGYEETLRMAEKGNYDANCRDCFKGFDTENVSLFAYACIVDFDIAKAIYENGADIEVSNPEFPRTPLLSALRGNRNNLEIVYWLIEQGADINAVDHSNRSVFHYLRFWDDTEETLELISYFEDNCDMQYLKEQTSAFAFYKWDEMWDEKGEFVFYE